MLKTIVVVSMFACLLATSASAHRSDFRPGTWPSATVLIGYSSEPALQAALRGRGAAVVDKAPRLRTVAVRPSGDAASFAADVSGRPGIDFVQAPVARRPLVEPGLAPASVPGGSYQWQYAVTGADRVPESVLRGAVNFPIAVIDSGADLSAPDIDAKRPLTYNAIDNSNNVTDIVGHGTFVASLAAGSASNGEGVAGMGGDARLIAVKASSEGRFTDFELAAGIAYAVDLGAKVINLSLGGTKSSLAEARALQYAFAKNVLVVAAAGNEAQRGNPVEYPAALLQPVGSNGVGGEGLAVGASTIGGTRAAFSNFGSYVSLAAPGHNVFGALSKDSSARMWPRVKLPGSATGLYGYSSGTSFAAPQVAGAAALVWAANPALSARQVADVLKRTASGAGQWNPELGYGVINVPAAVAAAATTPAVALSAIKFNNTVQLSWRGSTRKERGYRLIARVGNSEQVLVPSTTSLSQRIEDRSGDTHVYVVESLDAAGAVIARSSEVAVTLGAARSSLTLHPFRFASGGRRYSVVVGVLGTAAPDVKLNKQTIRLEQRTRHGWRPVGTQLTDASGRVIWVVPRGRYTIRARYTGTSELRSADSRALKVSGV